MVGSQCNNDERLIEIYSENVPKFQTITSRNLLGVQQKKNSKTANISIAYIQKSYSKSIFLIFFSIFRIFHNFLNSQRISIFLDVFTVSPVFQHVLTLQQNF